MRSFRPCVCVEACAPYFQFDVKNTNSVILKEIRKELDLRNHYSSMDNTDQGRWTEVAIGHPLLVETSLTLKDLNRQEGMCVVVVDTQLNRMELTQPHQRDSPTISKRHKKI
jgi:hypothetical protein